MTRTRLALFCLFCVLALFMVVRVAYSATATAATLEILDSTGTQRVLFNPGETVYINWTANGFVNINVYFEEDADALKTWSNQATTGQLTYDPPKLGVYYVECTGAPKRTLAVGSFFAVPSTPLGPISAFAACLGVLGIAKMRRSLRT